MTFQEPVAEPQEELAIEPVDAQEIEAQLRQELLSYTRTKEVEHILDEIKVERQPDDPHKGTGFYNSTLKETHKKQSQRRRNAILDPGGEKLKQIKRRNDPKRIERDEQRYARRVAEKTGQDVDMVRAEHDAMRAERAVKRALKAYLMNDLGYSDSGARKVLGGLTNEQETEVQLRAAEAGYVPESRTAGRSEAQRLRVPEWIDPPLPVRDPELSDSCNSKKVSPANQRIVIERDIDKSAVREQLARDTQAFLDAGGSITKCDDWYPADKHCFVIGGQKHIRSVWGYVPNKTAKGRKSDY